MWNLFSLIKPQKRVRLRIFAGRKANVELLSVSIFRAIGDFRKSLASWRAEESKTLPSYQQTASHSPPDILEVVFLGQEVVCI